MFSDVKENIVVVHRVQVLHQMIPVQAVIVIPHTVERRVVNRSAMMVQSLQYQQNAQRKLHQSKYIIFGGLDY